MFFGVKNSRYGQRGYTLIDLAMALTIFGLLLGGVASAARVYIKDKQITQTREYSRIVARAIENYVLEDGRFPCPAPVNAAPGTAAYGQEADCSGAYDAVTKRVAPTVAAGSFDAGRGLFGERSVSDANKFVVRGAVPFATLNLPEFYAYDAFGNRLMYAVTVAQTDKDGFLNSGGGAITVNGDAGTTHYIVFSSGAGEEGAWSRQGQMVKACVTTARDGANCDTAAGSNQATYVTAPYSVADGNNKFDDIVIAKSTKHMPTWKTQTATSADIKTAEDDKRIIIKSDVVASSVAEPPMPVGAKLQMDVSGDTGSRKANAPVYCTRDDGNNCFSPRELLKGSGSTFDCPAGERVLQIAGGRVICSGSLDYVCPGNSLATPKYIRGFDDKGMPLCEDYNFATEDPPTLIIGSCGSAHLQLMMSPPSGAALCSGGSTATVVNAVGAQWNWSCLGSGGGANASCVAYKEVPVVNGSCGSKHGQNVTSAPSDPNLCASGDAGPVTGTGPWAWLCGGQHGGTNATCSANWRRDGVCGTAQGVVVASPPTSGLCAFGTASAVTGSNPYNWTCPGVNGGASTSCQSGAPTTVNGTCGVSSAQAFYTQPTSGFCNSGVQGPVTGTGPWDWSCVGSGTPQGSTAGCQALRRQDAICGTAHGTTRATAPSTPAELCSVYSIVSPVSGSGPWTWFCSGINGGNGANCSANNNSCVAGP